MLEMYYIKIRLNEVVPISLTVGMK